MRLFSAICFVVVIFMSPLDAQEQLTAKHYDAAAKMLYKSTSPLVDRASVRPRWSDDGRFWYEVSVDGESSYVLYNPKTKKKIMSDNKSEITGKLPKKPARVEYNWRKEVLSPDKSNAAYIDDWNLWVRDIASGNKTQLTTDGIENFGYATDNAGWRHSDRPILLWSPDSKKIATYQQDQRHVSDMYLVKTEVGAPTLDQWKYPLPEDEKIIQIHRVIISVDNQKMVRLDTPPDDRRGTLCDDISCDSSFDDNYWSEDGSKLVFVSSSRDHKVAQLRVADTQTEKVKDIYKEEVATQYESGQGAINNKYLENSNEFIWYSERDNWGHLYLYDFKTGNLKNQITKGDFVVTRILKVDEEARKIYFLAQGREENRDPYFSHFYAIDFDGRNMKLLTPDDGHHSVSISPDGQYFVDNYSQPDIPNVAQVRSMDGKLVETLAKADISRLRASGWKAPTPIKVKSEDGKYDLYGLMYEPTEREAEKKYPVVNYVYPGPQGGGVGRRSFSPSRSDHQALAELGFVVIVIDGSCNPGRSKAFHDECYGDMSVNTLPDQISGIKQLAQKYDFIDAGKVGIWGHSGGGFATADAMFSYPEFYKVGIAESGNHDNRNYEDDWGERYNGLMNGIGNGTVNYRDQANQINAKNLKGKLMIAHGAMDDNVPISNSYLVVDALIKANKDFDLIVFPNARHGFGKDSYYMMRKRWDYFVTHLQGNIPPKEYSF